MSHRFIPSNSYNPRRPDYADERCERTPSLCARLARILEGKVESNEEGVCVISRSRDLGVEVAGRPARGPLFQDSEFSFQKLDRGDRTLNAGEVVLLQHEVNPFINAIAGEEIDITAVHNHWLFEEPRLIYVHLLSIDEPVCFAEKVARALAVIEQDDCQL